MGCLFFIVLFVAGIALSAGYFGLIPSLSKLMGTDRPRDLGIRWANVNMAKLYDSVGTKVVTTKELSGSGLEAGLLFEGEKETKYSISSEELTALVNSPWMYYPFTDVQIKIGLDDKVEASAMLKTDRVVDLLKSMGLGKEQIDEILNKAKLPAKNVPVYIKGNFSVIDGKAVVTPSALEIGQIPVPMIVLEKITPELTEAVNFVISNFPGFYIKNLSFSDGKMNFEGTVPIKQTILTY